MRRVRVQSSVREDPQHLLGEITKAASLVRAWRTATTSGQFRYTTSAGSVENSRGSRRAHGRLSSAAADGHVHRPRNATAFLQRVLDVAPRCGGMLSSSSSSCTRTMDAVSRRRISWPSAKERSKERMVVRQCYGTAFLIIDDRRIVREIVDDVVVRS